jgi:SNF2 family DNA or RNA helicase
LNGKTVCALTAARELLYNRYEANKILVVAPLYVADITWEEEKDKWDHLRTMKLSKIIGSKKQRIGAIRTEADIYTINVENVKWLIEYFIASEQDWPFDMIIIDESSKFKNSQSQRFKAIRKVTRKASRVVILTGTPAPNSLIDLWSQIYMLDQGERLGRSLTAYRNSFFTPDKRNRTTIFTYKLRDGAEKKIYKLIGDISVSLRAIDHIKMPERIDNMIKIKMPKRIQAIYDEMERDYLVQLDEDEITAASAGVVANKLLQMANGAVYDENRKVVEIHTLKLDAMEEYIEDNIGKPMLVLYNFQHDKDRILERFKKYDPKLLQSKSDKEAWDKGEVQLLVAHPASMGHGLNLQSGGSTIIWFGLTYNLEHYLQANARLYRQGQKDTVIINHLMIKDSRDEDAMLRLQRKTINQEDLIESIKAKIKKAKNK